ncbi:heptahelical transmembrane protein 1-like protein [Tanacetum coccineum]
MVVVGECGGGSEIHWWRRVKKVMVGRRRYGGVMVVEEIEWNMKKIWNKRHLIGFVVFVGLTITNVMHVPQVTDFLNLLTWHLIGFVVFVGLTITNVMHVPQVTDFLNLLTWSFPLSPGGNASHNSIMDTPKLIDLKHDSPLDMDIGAPLVMATRWPFFVFLGGSMFCLLSSSTCHLFGCHSHHLNLLLLQMDYVGITIMIITSFFPPIYYIFQCEPMWQFVYLGGITAMGAFTVITLLAPALSSGKFRSFRAFLFMAMGLFGIVPAIHAVTVNWYEPQRNGILVYETTMAVSYLTGTMFYITRIPERWMPGWFDLAGHSHQIFHCFVMMGALAHYGAALVFLEFRGQVGC